MGLHCREGVVLKKGHNLKEENRDGEGGGGGDVMNAGMGLGGGWGGGKIVICAGAF